MGKKKPKRRRDAPAAPAPPALSAPAPHPPPPIKKEEAEIIVLDDEDDKPLLPPCRKKHRRATPIVPPRAAPPPVAPPSAAPLPAAPASPAPASPAPPPAAPPSSLHRRPAAPNDSARDKRNAVQSAISNAAAPPPNAAQDDDAALCQTVVRPDGPAHVVVVSTERHAVAVRCPCERDCGQMVRVGKFAKFAQVGSPRCVHCRARVGSDLGFGSYAQLVAHVHTRTCRAVQAAHFARAQRRPPKHRLGEKTVRQINLPRHKSYRNGLPHFTCFRCSKEVGYSSRFWHCVECFGK